MVAESAAQGASLPRGVEACIHTLPESVVSLIPWRPRCSEEAAVPLGRPQSRKRCSDARDVCCTRQQTGEFCADPFVFDTGSAAAVGRQERWTQRFFVWLAEGGEDGGEL